MLMGSEEIPYNYAAVALSPLCEKFSVIAHLPLYLFIKIEKKNPYSEKMSFDGV